jgi:hypothetical protein
MKTKSFRGKFAEWISKSFVAILCILSIAPGDTLTYARAASIVGSPQDQTVPQIPNDQLDSLVAPVALYPDPLLAQVLAASTYPLEIIQLQQWLDKNKGLKDQALTDAVMKQDWDPSVQGLAPLPDVVKRLADDIKWTTDLGNAFLSQQNDVMDAVQRMRSKAQAAGNLKNTEQQKVETQTVESKTVIVVQQANPQVVYVPVYNPVVVYGPPIYPYPAIYYPPPSYYAAGVAIAFGVGIAMGSYWRGGWGYGCGWGRHTTVIVNRNNAYVRHYNTVNVNNINRNNLNGNNWQHNPQHRGGTPYSNRATANQYGGTTRGGSAATRTPGATQNQTRQQLSQGNASGRGANTANRGGGNGAGAANSNRGNFGGGAGNSGSQPTPTASTGAFGGAANRTSGNTARASSNRGTSSMGGSRGGGRRR